MVISTRRIPAGPNHDGCISTHKEYVRKFAIFPIKLRDRWLWLEYYYKKYLIDTYEIHEYPQYADSRFYIRSMSEDDVIVERLIEDH